MLFPCEIKRTIHPRSACVDRDCRFVESDPEHCLAAEPAFPAKLRDLPRVNWLTQIYVQLGP